MAIYQLWVKMDSGWVHACSVLAEDEHAALCKAVLLLRPEQKDRDVELRYNLSTPLVDAHTELTVN
jgi:hypothetical protein